MSDEYECFFSSTKLTVIDRCGRQKTDITEACECLQAWYGKHLQGATLEEKSHRYTGVMFNSELEYRA